MPINSLSCPPSTISCAPFTPCLTRVVQTVLHLAQTIAKVSSGFKASASALVSILFSICRCSLPFIGFISSAALAVLGSQAARAIAIAIPVPMMWFLIVFIVSPNFCVVASASGQPMCCPEID